MDNKNGFFAKIKWNRSQKKVNSAVEIFSKYGLGYSVTEGIIGDTSALSKKEFKAIDNASSIMQKNNAGYYRNSRNFKASDALHVTRNIPLNLSDYRNVQKKNAEIFFTSSHLKAGVKFIQRTIFDARLSAHPNRRRLKITPEQAQEWSATVEAEWRTDKYEKDWDITQQNDYSQLSDIALLEQLSVGEFFAIRRINSALLSGMSIQLISAFQVCTPYFSVNVNINYYSSCNELVSMPSCDFLSKLPDGNYISSGIEYNSLGQEIAIYVAPQKFGEGWTRIPVKNRSGFVQVLHGFIQQIPGQKRGLPESAMAYHEFMNIKDLQMFELESAKINATIAGTVTSDSNAQPNGLKPMGDIGVGWNDPDQSTTEAQQDIVGYKDPTYSVRKVEQGGFVVQNFTPGYKYASNDTKRPNVNNALFIEKELEYIYPASFGISVVCTRQRFDGSYNASKGAIDLTWKQGIEYHLKQFTSDWHKPNFDAWLTSKVAKGQIVATGYEDKYLRSAWQSSTIITPPKPSLNPLQEARGATQRVDAGFSNRELESQQLTGTSAEENAERLEQENIRLKKSNEIFEEVPNAV